MPRPLVLTAAMLAILAGSGAAQLKITHKWLGEENQSWDVRGCRRLGSVTPQLKHTLTELVRHSDNQGTSLAAATWRVLAFSGTGNNLRHGDQQKAMKRQLLSLLPRVAPKPDAKPIEQPVPERGIQVMANLAILRCHLEADYKLLVRYVDWGIPLALARFGKQDAPPTAAETLYLALWADSLLYSKRDRWVAHGKKVLGLAQQGAARLKPGADRFHDAIRHFVELVAHEREIDPELTTALCWPGDPLAAPLHAWLGAYTLRFMPPNVREAHWGYVERLLQHRAKDNLWPAAKGFDRKQTAAMMTAIVGMSYGAKGALPPGWKPAEKIKGSTFR